jgi:hypothetical protein
MSETQILDAIKALSQKQRFSIIESTISIMKGEIDTTVAEVPAVEDSTESLIDDQAVALGEEARRNGAPALPTTKSDPNRKSKTFAELADEMSAAGERALADGAPELPSDFSIRHDYYLYGIDHK